MTNTNTNVANNTTTCTFELPRFIAVSVACGRAEKGGTLTRTTAHVDVASFSDAALTAWLSAGFANIAGDKLANVAKETGLSGADLVAEKSARVPGIVASFTPVGPGRVAKPAKAKPAVIRIPSMDECRIMAGTVIPDLFPDMDADTIAPMIEKAAANMFKARMAEYEKAKAAKAAADAANPPTADDAGEETSDDNAADKGDDKGNGEGDSPADADTTTKTRGKGRKV